MDQPGNMTYRNLLLGRSKPSEKLMREEIAALDKVTVPPAPPVKPPGKKGGGPQRMVRKNLLKFRWSLECPGCGFKVTGDGQPKPGQHLARCGCRKVLLVLLQSQMIARRTIGVHHVKTSHGLMSSSLSDPSSNRAWQTFESSILVDLRL